MISLDVDANRTHALSRHLSPEEAKRAGEFHFEKDRASYRVCRGFLRVLLGRYIGVPPHHVCLLRGEHGKLHLDPRSHDPQLEFNVSHSGDLALIAISKSRRLGVDIEKIRQKIPVENISRLFFAPEENAIIHSLPEEARPAAFYSCWTRKEAIVKAFGGSIAQMSRKVAVSVLPDEPARLLHMSRETSKGVEWKLVDLTVEEGYAAALCFEGGQAAVTLWRPKEE